MVVTTDFLINKFMLTRTQKKKLVDDLSDKIKRQKSLIFTDITSVNVAQISKLRRELRGVEVDYKVAKKTLINLALKQENQNFNLESLRGSLALAFGYNDPISPIRALSKFAKENDKLKILGGIMEGEILTLNEIKELASLPSRDGLIALIVYGIKAPINAFVNVLQGNIRNLIGALNALANK